MHPKLPPQLGLLALVLATAMAAGEATAAAADSPSTPRKWTRLLDHRLTAKELGLPVSASSRTFARAALRRSAGPLGLRGSLRDVRLLSTQRAPRGRWGSRPADAALPADRRRAAPALQPDRCRRRGRFGDVDQRHHGPGRDHPAPRRASVSPPRERARSRSGGSPARTPRCPHRRSPMPAPRASRTRRGAHGSSRSPRRRQPRTMRKISTGASSSTPRSGKIRDVWKGVAAAPATSRAHRHRRARRP